MFQSIGLMKNLNNLKTSSMKAATSRLEQSKEAASKGVNMGRKIMKDTSSRTMQSIDVAGKGMAVAGKGVMDMTNKLGGATLASLEAGKTLSSGVVDVVTQRTPHNMAAAREARQRHVMHCLEDFNLQAGAYQTTLIVAKAHGQLIDVVHDGQLPRHNAVHGYIVAKWYRAIAYGDGGTFQLIDGTHANFYQPSADDVGARVCCQLSDAGWYLTMHKHAALHEDLVPIKINFLSISCKRTTLSCVSAKPRPSWQILRYAPELIMHSDQVPRCFRAC
jgi:hypothetical protein